MTLQKGNTGTAVEALQTLLSLAGADLGPTGVDGKFGDYTERAVMAFQAAHGLTPDGVVGPETAGVLGLDLGGGSTASKVIGAATGDDGASAGSSTGARAAWYAGSAGLIYLAYRRWFKK